MPESCAPAAPAETNGGPTEARRLAAIAFVDIVGYSLLMAEDEARTHGHWMQVLSEHIRPAATRHRGSIVKSTGDGVLAEFPSAHDAVAWARDVQTRLGNEHASPDGPRGPITLRIAVHLGDVYSTAEDIYGDGVNVTARLQEHAAPGGIVLSEAVHDLVRGSLDVPVRDLGLLHLKNIPTPLKAYALGFGQSTAALQVRRAPAGALPSIAVLPLRNLSQDPEDVYFSEGIVEDILVSLAGLKELMVIARTSSIVVGRNENNPREAGRALGVRYVLTGSVRRSPRRVRVSVQLHDVQSGVNLWGESAEMEPGELFDVQDRIVSRIVTGIAPHVRSAELRSALRKQPESFTAYDLTLNALDRINSLDMDRFLEARDYLDKAMAEDPGFAMPIAWAARWHSLLIGQGWSTDRAKDSARAVELAARAIELDPRNALALATYGHLRSYLYHDYDTALVYFERALEACPNAALAWILTSGTLSYLGRGEEAVRHAEHALSLSPFDQTLFYYYVFLAMAHYASGNYAEAVKWGRMSMSEKPSYTSNLRILSAALSGLGREDEAKQVAGKLLELEPGFSLATYEQTLQPFAEPALRARYLEHLAQTDLPS